MRTTKSFIAIAFLVASILALRPAIAQVAPGVQQSAAQTATVAGSVINSSGAVVAGANVKLIGPAVLATTSDLHGSFLFVAVPHGIYTLIASARNLGVASKTDLAVKGDVFVQIQYAQGSTQLKTIANVTNRSAGVHINLSAASVADITPRDYAFQGNTTWTQMLQRIPGVAVNGGSYGGFGSSGIVGSPLSAQIVSINGALPFETSTTLDGMPFTNSTYGNFGISGGSTDLSVLSMGAFEAADVVRGPGANSPSIVNSIGGSLVLHAPGETTSNHYEFSLSTDAWGGLSANSAFQYRISKQLSAHIGYDFYNSPGPQGTNARMLEPAFVQPSTVNGQNFYGCGNSYGNPPACTVSNIPGTPGYASCPGKYQNCSSYLSGLLLCCTSVSTAWTKHDYFAGFSYKISPSVNAQLFSTGSSYADQGSVLTAYNNSAYFQPFASGYVGKERPGGGLFNEAGTFTDPTSEASWLTEERVTAFMGEGVLRLSALQNNTYWDVTSANSLVNGQYALYGTGYYCGATCDTQGQYVVFNGTPASVTFSASSARQHARGANRDFLASYATQIGPRSSLGASFVQSYVDTPWFYSSFLIDGTDFCAVLPGLCAGQDPSISATTREVRINGHTDVSNKLSLDGSYYFARGFFHVGTCGQSNFSTVCHQYTDFAFPYRAPRLGATWRASRDVVIRAATGGGFALPQLAFLTGGSAGVPDCSSGMNCVESRQNLNLQPEKSFGIDVGSDVRIRHDTMISLDFYRTNLYGQFYQKFDPAGTYNGLPLYIYEYENLVPTRYEGVNVSFKHDPGPSGTFWSGGLGLTRSFIVSLPNGFYNASPGLICSHAAPANCTATELIPGQNFTGGGYTQSSGAQPYANGYATAGYRWSPQSYVSISPTYYGPNNTYFVPAFLEFDASASYGINKHVTILLSFRNIFDANSGSNICSNCANEVLGAPAAFGMPYHLYPNPWGPRTAILTLNFKG